jgi:hypothetical protein
MTCVALAAVSSAWIKQPVAAAKCLHGDSTGRDKQPCQSVPCLHSVTATRAIRHLRNPTLSEPAGKRSNSLWLLKVLLCQERYVPEAGLAYNRFCACCS